MLNIHKTRFAPRIFLTTTDKPGGAGGDNPKPGNLTPEQQLAKARDDLAASTKERDDFKSQLEAVTKERDDIKSQFESLTKTAEKANSDLAEANKTISTLTSERDSLKTERDTANGHKARLEQLCSVQGIDPNAAPKVEDEPKDELLTQAQWSAKIEAATDPVSKAKLMAEFTAALGANKVKP